jgi:hypothetical protein
MVPPSRKKKRPQPGERLRPLHSGGSLPIPTNLGSHFDDALRAMDKISRYETRALSKRRRVVGKAPSD